MRKVSYKRMERKTKSKTQSVHKNQTQEAHRFENPK